MPLDKLLPFVIHAMRIDYEDPDTAGVPYESAEGGYLIELLDSREVLDTLGITDDERVLSALADAMEDSGWVPQGWAFEDPWTSGWEHFREVVRTKRRYTFHSAGQTSTIASPPPNEVPAMLVRLVAGAGLVKPLPRTTRWWRARVHDSHEPTPKTASELGAPPAAWAKDNRMAPRGIPVFSGASSWLGACKEVANYARPDQMLTYARFEPLREMKVVDLRDPPAIPPLYDPNTTRGEVEAKRFLHGFIADLTLPSPGGPQQGLDYIPSQIVAEHFRYDLGVDGLLWTSSVDPDTTVCALFLDNDEMAEPDEGSAPSKPWGKSKSMRLVPHTRRSICVGDVP